MNNITVLSAIARQRVLDATHSYIERKTTASTVLTESMLYVMRNGGKRLRPLLIYCLGESLGIQMDLLDAGACAIEMIHTYSLIHDDLPAMDDSALRRGQPTCHKVYGDAIAILVGDTLQPLAYEIIATHPSPLSSQQRVDTITALSQASGVLGIAAGQVLDITASPKNLTQDQLDTINYYKTGSLLSACLHVVTIAGNISDEMILETLGNYTKKIGLAYQIQDDIFDIEVDPNILGKPNGLDQSNNKLTYPRLIGMTAAKNKVNSLFDEATQPLKQLNIKTDILVAYANFVLGRQY
jgi:farnesyl diphosphate synthase